MRRLRLGKVEPLSQDVTANRWWRWGLKPTQSLTQDPQFGPTALPSCPQAGKAPSQCLTSLLSLFSVWRRVWNLVVLSEFLPVARKIQGQAEPHLCTLLDFLAVTRSGEGTFETRAALENHQANGFLGRHCVGGKGPSPQPRLSGLPSQTRQWGQGSWSGPGTRTWGCCSHPARTLCHVCSGGSGRGLAEHKGVE